MTGNGRPLRFLGLVTLGWICARIALLWPQTGSLPEAIRALVPAGIVPARAAPAASPSPPPRATIVVRRTATPGHGFAPRLFAPRAASDPRVQMAMLGLVYYGAPESVAAPLAALPAGAMPMPAPISSGLLAPDRLDPLPDRWSASAWLVARGGSGAGAAPGGQIGGGQAGARLAWMLVPRARVAVFGRVTTPLAGRGREAAAGIEWQPTRAPVRLVAERRFGLDGTRGGTGLGVIAGIDAELGGFRLEGYGQAGAIGRGRIELYADGAARGTRTIGAVGEARLAIGAGAWGAAQRDAQRLDVGPSATLAVRNLRIALDWRQRVAGEARPGSGLTLTLGADF